MRLHENTDESELLVAIQAGDYSAFNEIYERYWSLLYASAYNVLRDKDAASDVVQEIFIWFWEHRSHWKLSSCKGYLLTAVRYKVANQIRSNNIRLSFFERIAELNVESFEDGNSTLEAADLKRFIEGLIDKLPEKCQQIFRLSRLEQLSNPEIAKKLGISEKTVENQITIAIKKLRSMIGNNNALLFLLL